MKRKSKKWSLALGALAMTCSFGVAMSLTSFTPASAAMPRAVATYSSEDAKTSATLSSFKVDGFGALSDFTDWFDVSYDMFLAEKSLDDYVTYNESSQSVTISNTSGSYVDGMGGTGAAFANLDPSTPTTITVGYVNNYAYFYYGDHLVNGYNVG